MNSSIATMIMIILTVQVASVIFCREPRLITWDLPELLGAHHMRDGAWRQLWPHPPSTCGSSAGDRSTWSIICLYEQGGSRQSDWSLPEVVDLMNEADKHCHGDFRDNYSPGWKFNHWELKVR